MLGAGLALPMVALRGHGPAPAYDLNFAFGATAASLTSAGFTFARTGTAWDRYGTAYATGVPRINDLGLIIEGARTNLVTSSNAFATFSPYATTVAAADAADPSGAVTAARLTKTATAFANVALSGVTVTNGSTYACSCYFKAGSAAVAVLRLYSEGTIDVGIKVDLATGTVSTYSGSPATSGSMAVGTNGWYRIWFSAALANTSTAVYVYPGDPDTTTAGYVHAAFCQLELSSFPSSPIVTTGTTVTRNAETCSATRSAGVLSAGSVALRVRSPLGNDNGNQQIYSASLDTNNRYGVYRNSSLGSQHFLNAASVTQAQSSGGSSTAPNNSIIQLASRWDTNNVALSRGGTIVHTDTVATIPAITVEHLGTRNSGSEAFFGHIMRVRRYTTALTDAQLIALSA